MVIIGLVAAVVAVVAFIGGCFYNPWQFVMSGIAALLAWGCLKCE